LAAKPEDPPARDGRSLLHLRGKIDKAWSTLEKARQPAPTPPRSLLAELIEKLEAQTK